MKHLGFASIPAVQQYLRYAESEQLNLNQAISEAGLDQDVLRNENGRIKGEQFQNLIKSLLIQSDDPLLGLHSARFVQPGSYSVLGYIAMSCATIGEAIDKIPVFEKLVGDMGVTSIRLSPQSCVLEWHCAYEDSAVRQHMIDNVLASWTNYARWLANTDTAAQEIRLERSKPGADLAEAYEAFFKCPVLFESGCNRIIFERDLLALPLRQPDKMLLKTLEDHAQNRLSTMEEEEKRFSIRVSDIIRRQLTMGSARKELIAAELNMTSRTLQRKLENEGHRYQELLDQVRLQCARELLAQRHLALQDIAINLGFSDHRAFHRRFKDWTGLTPGQYRASTGSKTRAPVFQEGA